MTFETIMALFIGVALLAAKPGPGVMTVAMKAIGEGVPAVLSFMVGTNLVKILFFCLVVFGYQTVEGEWVFISLLLKALAAVYLIWTGIKGFQKFETPEPNEGGLDKKGFLSNLAAGFMLTVSNPFDIIFFAGILPSLFDLSTLSAMDFVIAAGVIVAADSLVALSYALPLAFTRHLFKPGLLRKVNMFASVGIILVGLYIGYTALPAQDILSISKPEISEGTN